MRRVLVTSTYFASDVTIGSARVAGLARYLPDHGWLPTILTPELPRGHTLVDQDVEVIEYADLYGRVRRSVGEPAAGPGRRASGRRSFRSRAASAAQYVLVPDWSIGWLPGARHAIRRLEKEGRRFDAVLSSSNPRTPHLIARGARRTFDAPWVADLRDFWTIDHYYRHGFPRKPLERRLERHVLGDADALVTVSEPYARRLGSFLDREVHSVLNGFDPELWNEPPTPLTEKLTISYTGSLALGKRDPTLLLEALAALLARGEVDRQRIAVRFFGRREGALDDLVARLGLEDVVTQRGYVDRADAIRRQQESHVLVIFFYDHPDEEGVLTGKVEYFAARRPILGIGGPGGAMEDLLETTVAGEYVRAHDRTRAEAVLLRWWREYEEHGRVLYRGVDERVRELSQTRVAEQFAAILDGVARA